MQIEANKTVEKLYRKYMTASNEFVKDSLESFLIEKRRKYKIELNQLLRKYNANDAKELENKIKKGIVEEHPAWEDLIEIENLIEELKDIESDLAKLS
ncbi:MAG: hypothetical protein Q7S39_04655 [Ignavibacteria bacterium]|nr:hypothetical protein [Ignavibacteria bacterium]